MNPLSLIPIKDLMLLFVSIFITEEKVVENLILFIRCIGKPKNT